jgi:hypothetical protein
MANMDRRAVCVLLLLFLVSACSSPQAVLDATTTQVAAELYGTQTALAPTATASNTPTATATFTPTATITLTPTITNTPLPPTATLTAEEVETLKVCFKAAVIIQADWKVHDIVAGGYSYSDQKYQDLNAFLWERRNRIQVYDRESLPLGDDTIVVGGVELKKGTYSFSRDDCAPHWGTLLVANNGLRQGPWGVGAGNRISAAKTQSRTAVNYFRKALTEIYGVDPAELEAIEAPIWDNVAARYGVEDPIP